MYTIDSCVPHNFSRDLMMLNEYLLFHFVSLKVLHFWRPKAMLYEMISWVLYLLHRAIRTTPAKWRWMSPAGLILNLYTALQNCFLDLRHSLKTSILIIHFVADLFSTFAMIYISFTAGAPKCNAKKFFKRGTSYSTGEWNIFGRLIGFLLDNCNWNKLQCWCISLQA